MSAAAEGATSTTKAVASDETSSTALKDQQKPAAALEEDDEFEDFPVEGSLTYRSMTTGSGADDEQIGRRKTQKYPGSRIRTCGRKVGMTMIRARISPNS